MSQFLQPGISNPEDKFVASEHNGQLLLFFPTQLQQQVKTQHGDADAVATKIVNLDTGRVIENALIFATALVTQLRAAVPDGMVLGRLGQGQNTKGNPPWLLSPHNDQEVAQAEAYLAANPRNQFAQPQVQAAPPAPAAPAPAWGQQPPAAAPAAPATGGWGNPAPAAAQTNAAAAGWGAPAPQPQAVTHNPVQAQATGNGWGGPAAAPTPPAAPAPAPTATSNGVHPDLAAALGRKGYQVPPGATQEAAEQLWASVQGQPDVA